LRRACRADTKPASFSPAELPKMTDSPEISFNHITNERFLADIEAVACQIERSDWRPDYIVGIGRGGLVPGAFLSHRTGIPLLSIDHSSKVEAFAQRLLIHLAGCSEAGERFLFIDDINDSGKTIVHFRDTVRDNGNPANVRFAALVNNRSSCTTVDYFSWSIDRTVDKDWFVFPWEAVAPKATVAAEALEDPDRLGLHGGL
ncbi:MAG: phosphoribosyltransferase family protein, partial [Sphingobium sp.]